jgi:hypothetical protein
MANKQRAEDQERQDQLAKLQTNQWNRQHQLAQNRFSFDRESAITAQRQAERQSEVGLGLSLTQTGTTMATRYGDKTFGGLIDSGKRMFGMTPSAPTSGVGNFMSNLSVGSAIGGGLAGFGTAKLLGKKKSKVTKGLAGAGVGAALGLLGGGFGGGISGGFAGGLGGLFG